MIEVKKNTKVRFAVHVKPHASKIAVEKGDGDIRISLTASPRKSLANRQLIEILSKELRIARCCISIVRGLKGHDKLIEISDITEKRLNNWMEGI